MSGADDTPEGAPAPAGEGPDLAALAAIEAEARGASSGGVAAPGAAAAPAESTNAQDLEGALMMARAMVAPMFAWWPEFGQVWGDATLQGIAQSGGAVMDKHGWTTGGMWGEFGPYIALGMATVPPAYVTAQAIKARKLELQRQAHQPAGEGPPGVSPQ